MTHRQLFEEICAGNRPAGIPFAPDITDWYCGQHRRPGEPLKYGPGVYIPHDDPIKYERGIGIAEKFYGRSLLDIHRQYNWGIHCHTRDWYQEYYSDGVTCREVVEGDTKTITYQTPRGTLDRVYKLAADGSWCSVDYLLDGPHQLEILYDIIEATRFRLLDENIRRDLDAVGDWGHADIVVNRSPFGKLLHEYLGFEQTTYLLFDRPGDYARFDELQTRKDLELIALACSSSCRLVLLCDHADATLFSPDWYERYCIPFYRRAGTLLKAAGKRISTHLDGNLGSLLPLLGETGFHVLDGCTPAPMFDYEPEALAAAMPPDMVAFVGVPSSLFCDNTPLEDILAYADRLIRALPGRLILNVGDILPVNGNIEHVIALGEHIHEYNRRIG